MALRPKNRNPIAVTIYDAMVARGLNPTSLAKEVGVNATYFRDLFRNVGQRPSSVHMPRIAKALGLNVTALVDPTATNGEHQADGHLNEPEHVALLAFWRLLSREGKARIMRAIAREIQGADDGC